MGAVLVLLLCSLAAPPAVRAGAAARAITPELSAGPVHLAGYQTGRVAEEVHDDLWARALVVEADGQRVAFVALDLIGWFLGDVLESRARLRRDAGIDHLFVLATHTHSGPDVLGLWGPSHFASGRSEAYARTVRARLEEAVAAAAAGLRPAALAFAQESVTGLIQDRREPYVVDDRLAVLVADGLDGAPIATFTVFPVHPEVLGRTSAWLSSDFPHFLRRRLEAARGGLALHASGSIGGLMTPDTSGLVDAATGAPPAAGSLRAMKLYGERLAEAALALASGAPQLEVDRVRAAAREVFIPLENGWYRAAFALGVVGGRPLYTGGRRDERCVLPLLPGFPRYALGEDLKTEVALLRLGDVTFAAVPGEIYPELTLGRVPATADPGRDFPAAPVEPALAALLPGRHGVILGLANDEIGYVIPRSWWDAEPPYTFGRVRAPYGEINSVGPSAAPRLLEAFADLAAELR